MLVDAVRMVDLRRAAAFHHHHAVADRHRLALVVRDHHRGGTDLALDLAQLELHLLAQLGVEVRQRLVEQEHRRLDHQRARQRHALPLAARELARIARGMGLEVHQRQRLLHALTALGLRHLAHLEAEAHVVGHRHVRKQRIALEHDAQAARVGLGMRDVLARELDAAAGHGLEARDHLQRGGLAAARGAEQRDELALLDSEVHGRYRAGGAIGLGHVAEPQE